MKKLLKILFIIFFLLSFNLFSLNEINVDEIKIICIEKISRFVDWPEDENHKKEFNIYILGKPSFEKYKEFFEKNIKIKNKDVKLVFINNINDFKDADILFIGQVDKKDLDKILEIIKDKDILTISDTDGFGKRGIMVNMYFDENNTIKFEVNITSLAKSNLKMSSKFLKIVKIIK